jgi:hypothetical protein
MAAKSPDPVTFVKHPGTYPEPAARKPVKKMVVYNPQGQAEEHPVPNARDLVRCCGYSYAQRVRAAAVAVDAGVAGEPGAEPAADGGEASNPALDALAALRAEAAELGISVDNRWGTKRLKDEIAFAKDAKNEVSGTPQQDEAGEE